MVNFGVHIGECVSTHYVRLTRTFRMLIQKSMGMDIPLLSISFFFLFFVPIDNRHTKPEKKKRDCTGLSKLLIAVGKMADFGEQKENYHLSDLAA